MMNAILFFMQEHAKIIVQIFGIFLIWRGFSSTGVILEKSATYFDYNQKLATELIKEDYDKRLGLFAIAIPEILFELELSYWLIYLCLVIGIIFITPCIKNHFVRKRERKVQTIYEQQNENLE